MASQYVTLGNRAYSFHDPALGISIAKGETRELSDRQMQSRRIRAALNSGHLRIVTEDPKKVAKYTEEDIEKLDKKLRKQVDKGVDTLKITSAFTEEEAKLLAAKHNIELEESDTLESIITAIVEDVKGGES